jgi:hypothetical protein
MESRVLGALELALLQYMPRYYLGSDPYAASYRALPDPRMALEFHEAMVVGYPDRMDVCLFGYLEEDYESRGCWSWSCVHHDGEDEATCDPILRMASNFLAGFFSYVQNEMDAESRQRVLADHFARRQAMLKDYAKSARESDLEKQIARLPTSPDLN